MSQYLDTMPLHSTITVDGPHGTIMYQRPGVLTHLGEHMEVRHFGAIAGGTGITPIMQVSSSTSSSALLWDNG